MIKNVSLLKNIENSREDVLFVLHIHPWCKQLKVCVCIRRTLLDKSSSKPFSQVHIPKYLSFELLPALTSCRDMHRRLPPILDLPGSVGSFVTKKRSNTTCLSSLSGRGFLGFRQTIDANPTIRILAIRRRYVLIDRLPMASKDIVSQFIFHLLCRRLRI